MSPFSLSLVQYHVGFYFFRYFARFAVRVPNMTFFVSGPGRAAARLGPVLPVSRAFVPKTGVRMIGVSRAALRSQSGRVPGTSFIAELRIGLLFVCLLFIGG